MFNSRLILSNRKVLAALRQRSSSTSRFLDGLDDSLGLLRSAGGRGSVTLTKGVGINNQVAIIKFDNAVCKNAFSTKMMVEFYEAVEQLKGWEEGRAVIITGSNGTFCSGADLGNSKEFFTKVYGAAMNQVMTAAAQNLKSLPLTSVAVVDGFAVGGGAELLTSTDYRVLSSRAKVQFVHASRGVVPGWGGVARLTDIIGKQRAMHLLQSGVEISPEKALSLNLCDAVVDVQEEKVETFVDDVISGFLAPIIDSSKANNVVRSIKEAVSSCRRSGEEESDVYSRYAVESAIFRSLWGAEAQMSFMKQWESSKKKSSKPKDTSKASAGAGGGTKQKNPAPVIDIEDGSALGSFYSKDSEYDNEVDSLASVAKTAKTASSSLGRNSVPIDDDYDSVPKKAVLGIIGANQDGEEEGGEAVRDDDALENELSDVNSYPQSFKESSKVNKGYSNGWKQSGGKTYSSIDNEMMMEEKNSIFSDAADENFVDIPSRHENKAKKAPRRSSTPAVEDEDVGGFNIFNSKPVRNRFDIDDTSDMVDLGESQSNIMKKLRQHQYDRYKLDENDPK